MSMLVYFYFVLSYNFYVPIRFSLFFASPISFIIININITFLILYTRICYYGKIVSSSLYILYIYSSAQFLFFMWNIFYLFRLYKRFKTRFCCCCLFLANTISEYVRMAAILFSVDTDHFILYICFRIINEYF